MADRESPVQARLVAGRYQLVRELGRGGMGVVWLAEDQLVGRPAAVKELRPPPGLTADERETFSRRALQEARSAARIGHPGAVTLYDVLPASPGDDAVYLIMELAEGTTLSQLIQRDGALPASAVAAYGLQLLSVLEAAHRLGVVHRDVKPANIIITPGGQAKLTDFGIAHTVGDARLTRSGIMGTQAYMAPELFEGAAITPAADLWSLGATLFAAAEGRGPFERDTTGATLRAIVIDEPPLPRCQPSLAAAISGMLQRDPARRATIAQARAYLLPAAELPAPPRSATDQATATLVPRPASDQATSTAALGPRPGPAAGPPAPWAQVATTRSPSSFPAPSPAPRVPEPTPPRLGRRVLVIAGVAAAALVAAAIAVPVLLSGNNQPAATPQPTTPAATPSGAQPAATLADQGSQGASVQSVTFSPDGKTLAIGDSGGNSYLWDVATAKQVATLDGPSSTAGVDALAFSPDGTTLAIGDADDSVYLWNVPTRGMTATLLDSGTVNTAVNSVAFSPGGQTVAAGDLSGRTYLWNVASHSIVATLADPAASTEGVSSVAFSPNGQMLAAGDGNDSTYLWNVASHSIAATLPDPGGKNAAVDSVAFSPNGQMLAVGDGNGKTYVWNVATRSIAATLAQPGGGSSSVKSVAFSPGGQLLAAGSDDDRIYLFNVAAARLTTTLTDPLASGPGHVNAVAFSPDGTKLATGDADDLTFLWHVG